MSAGFCFGEDGVHAGDFVQKRTPPRLYTPYPRFDPLPLHTFPSHPGFTSSALEPVSPFSDTVLSITPVSRATTTKISTMGGSSGRYLPPSPRAHPPVYRAYQSKGSRAAYLFINFSTAASSIVEATGFGW